MDFNCREKNTSHQLNYTRKKWAFKNIEECTNLRSSGSLRSAQQSIRTDVSGQSIGPIFEGQEIKEEEKIQFHKHPSHTILKDFCIKCTEWAAERLRLSITNN
jgi:hypothetical protein